MMHLFLSPSKHTLLSSQYYIKLLLFVLPFCLAYQATRFHIFPICNYHSLIRTEQHTMHRHHCGLLSTHSSSAAILPLPRPPIFPNEFTLDNPLKLLLLPSFKFRDFLDLLALEPPPISAPY